MRPKFSQTDLSEILDDETLEAAVKEAAEVSMGTEIADLDVINIQALAEQVLSMTEYRIQLFEYLKNRMQAIAPNLTVLVGELVGARLIAHAASLMNLAKQPASTVQILGAEKALFRALKMKHDTPKYGLIFHASLVGQAQPKHKGKISRVLAAKCALSIRVDALGETTGATIGVYAHQKVEERMNQLEGKMPRSVGEETPSSKSQPKVSMYADGDASRSYNVAGDSTVVADAKKEKKEKKDKEDGGEKKKKKKDEEGKEKKKKKRDDDDDDKPKKKKKKDA